MSGPYRFNGESAKSPLERSSSPFSAGQPVSFKTNVNRAKTKKWVTAKKNAYDGDDWGGYDEYDEYGVEDEAAAQPAPSQRYYAGGQAQRTHTDRSFTEPIQPGPPGKVRRNSFEAGEEHRAFSASIPPPQQGYGQQQYGEQPRQTSGAESDMGHEPQDRRDFTPSAMPHPLQTQMSPMPADINSSPARSHFPPRKSSIGQSDSPIATSPRPRTGSHSDKPLPFVRPADIYKRVEEERERERASLDSSRPSLDSLSSRPKDDLHSPTSDGGRMLKPLETVAERKSEYLPDFDSAFVQNDKQPGAAGAQSQAPGSHAPVVSPPSDQGFRSVVDQAFTRADDQRSIPPTPISKDDDSSMSRTNTGSTTGISPIMSRVPSGATSALKRNQAGVEGSTPAIAEEPSDTATFVPGATSTLVHDPPHAPAPKAAVSHSRNISSSSLPHSGLATPTRGDSPARSPVISPHKDLPEPKAAQIAMGSPDEPSAMEGGLAGPSPAYAAREADIATAARSGPESAAPGLGAAEQQFQAAFLESHAGQSPIEDAFPRSRSESPSKGRVQALAGKFGDVSQSRRGSTQSNMSRNSVQSWEKSQHSSRAPSPTKGSPSKPSSPVKEFRPHLPGQWESYATTAATPMDQSERDRSLDFQSDKATNSLEGADLTPTTAKHPVDEIKIDDGIDPIAALKSAGAAMAQSFKATVGMDDASLEPHNQQASGAKDASYGDMYMPRPLQLERTISSLSSIPPTPPAKDTPRNEEPPQLPSKDVDPDTPVQHNRPEFFPQLSTQPSADDQESDRLRKEIVASLTPVASADPSRRSLQPASPGANRASSILPAEYDSYWADGGNDTSPRPSQEVERSIPTTSAAAAPPVVPPPEELPKPSLLNRFSWENNTPQSAAPVNVVGTTPVPEPTKTEHEETIPSPAVERAAEEQHQQWSEGLPDPYFGPGHTITVTKPDPITEPESSARSPTTVIDHDALASPTREQTRSPGLHVVNSAVDPEAVDLPPRLSADIRRTSEDNLKDELKQLEQEVNGEKPNPAVSTSINVPEPQTPTQANAHAPSAVSPTSGKPLGAREIATINSAAERISTYNQTREHWATHDHGLQGWLVSTIDANPELASQNMPVQRVNTGTVRHKHTASLSLLGKLGGASTHQLGTEQSPSTPTQGPVGANSPTSGGPGSASAFDRRVASRQLEAKGKDLLHTANLLSGKGLTSAKGLFAKGKSRFGREKAPRSRTDSMPSSREASEEPEFMVPPTRRTTSATATPDKPLPNSPIDTDSPREDRKKRRFSIASFQRSSRSRSRPNSIVLPSNISFFSSTPKGTPPRELSRILGEDKSRPHSYHAPDSWNITPDQQHATGDPSQSTPPREPSQTRQSRLGILPSPAKSAFSAHDQDDEQIPPVPRIPDTVRLSHDLSHEVLQSVIRYATPPIPAANDTPALSKSLMLRNGPPNGIKGQSEQSSADGRQNNERHLGLGDMQRLDATLPKTTVRSTIDNNVSPQVEYGQWPLVNQFPPGASVSASELDKLPVRPTLESRPVHPSRFGPQAPVQRGRSVKRQKSVRFSNEGLEDDDQPPKLSYEPIPASQPHELEALPSYLVPTHLDVSDDEDYSQNRTSPKLNGRLHLTAPQGSGMDVVSPLLKATKSSHSRMSAPARTQTAAQGGLSKGVEHGARRGSDALAPDVQGVETDNTHPSALLREPSVMRPLADTTGGAEESDILSTSLQAESKPTDATRCQKSESSLNASTERSFINSTSPVPPPSERGDDEAPQVSSRDQASSPAPVWFAKSELRSPKTRAPGAAGVSESTPQRVDDAIERSQPGVEAAQGVLLAPHTAGSVGSADGTQGPTRRVSASPLQVVHAVEECAASNSSFTSWDRNSVSANSVSGISQPGDMRDESDLVTPVAQVPRIVQHGQAAKAEELNGSTRNSATPNGYFGGHEIPSHAMRFPQQQSSELTVPPERSKSMLSMISSMVSEGGTPISPASSNAGRSTPSTIRRMHHDSSARNTSTSAQIPEEPVITNGDRTPTASDDDYDLYADHNGIVKDLRDENGQPLRLSQDQATARHEHPQSSKPSISAAASSIETHGEDGSRYSSERPMSFISGPTDQDGRPQDQVNQPLKQGNAASRTVAGQLPGQNQQADPATTSTIYSTTSPPQSGHQPNSQHSLPQEQQPARVPVASSEQFRRTTPEHARPHVPVTNALGERPTPAAGSFQPPMMIAQVSQPGPPANHYSHDPRMYGAPLGQPNSQRPLMQGQMTVPDHDPRFRPQQGAQSYGPRNEYELQQQRMQLQAQHPSQTGSGAGPYAGVPLPAQQAPKQQDKPSSLPKLSAVFKGLGGKLQGNTQQSANLPNSASRPSQHQTSIDPNRNASYNSGVSSIHPEQPPTRLGEPPVSSASPNRPPSNGAESHFSHASQGSTHAQPTHSRVDLRKPASPMPFQGIPPQIFPQGVPKQSTQPQPYRASTGGVPETGKKKRFSTLGNIFNRSSDGQPGKAKLSKEEKKAQRNQRQSSAPQMQAPQSQWAPQQPQFRPQQNGMPYPPGQHPPGQHPPGQYPPQQMRPTGPQFASAQTMSPAGLHSAQSMDPYGPSQHYQQAQPRLPSQQVVPVGPSEQGSAYMRTKQLAEQHQAQKALAARGQGAGPVSPPGSYVPRTSMDHHAPQPRQTSYGSPPGGYYNPNPTPVVPEQGAYKTTQAARQTAEQQHQQSPIQGAYGVPRPERRQQTQYQGPSTHEEEAYRALHAERLRLERDRLQFESEQRIYNNPGAGRAQQHLEQRGPQDIAHNTSIDRQQQPQRQQEAYSQADYLQSAHVHQNGDLTSENRAVSHDEQLRAHQERQERQQLEQQFRSQQYADMEQPSFQQRAVSGPVPSHVSRDSVPVAQRRVSSPIEPQYETPQIPAAYSHVSGAFISPLDREQQPHDMVPLQSAVRPGEYNRHYSDPRMPPISPQVSAQSQMPPNNRTHSDASTVSVVSPISTPAQGLPNAPLPPDQRVQNPRMSSISEVHQGTPERPWHLNFPEGATEQEIVRARQRQFMQQQFITREQQHAERVNLSPSPRASPHSPSPAQPVVSNASPQQQGGGFRELLPRSSPQPYAPPQLVQSPRPAEQVRPEGSPQPPLVPALRSEPPHQPAAYPLPMSPESANARSPEIPFAGALPPPPLPPPKLPHSPMHSITPVIQPASSPGQQHTGIAREHYEPSPPGQEHYSPPPPPPPQESSYDNTLLDEPPPSYDGPGVPNDGMHKSRPEQPRPPNITTDVKSENRGPQNESRSRQPSIGMLQHPQPASMAASPQRSSADMGAESLRHQLLQQEEHARMERIQRAQIQRAESEREKQERDAARARARELEQSVSGGARVGSIRSVGGSRSGGHNTSRQVFELPAVEDDEPAMRATSYPGQEWVPQFWTDD